MSCIKTMFDPETIALVGATDEKGALGRTVLENLLGSRERRIFPVTPHGKDVLGQKSYPSLASVPEPVTLAVVATPARGVPCVVEECGQAGVKGAVILSSGFRELGEEGAQVQGEISRIRQKYGMRLLGPNCLGFVRPNLGLNATSLRVSPPPGDIAFICQSDALGNAILDWAVGAGIGFSLFASLGSAADIGFGDMIDFLGDDEATRSILIYMEDVGDARRFMSAARAFARQKPIIILKPGRFSGSARPALSQTSALAKDDSVYEAAFRRAGAVRVGEIAELFHAAQVLDSKRLPTGPRLAVVTPAHGLGLMATDALIHRGGTLAVLSEESITQLDAFQPPGRASVNPIDVGENATVGSFAKALAICVQDRAVDGVLLLYVPMDTAPPTPLARAVVEGAKGAWKPVLAAWMGAEVAQEGRRILVENSIPTYATPEEAVRTYVNMWSYRSRLDQLYETPDELPAHEVPSKDRLKERLRATLKEGRTLLTDEESKSLLAAYGIPVAESEGTGADHELILGAKKDRTFGSVILFGMGGNMAELIGDFSVGLPPLNQTLAKVLMQDTKAYEMLRGARGDPPADLEELEEILVNFSNLIVDFPEIAEIAINPLAISKGKIFAGEARIILDEHYEATGRSPYSHLVITPYPTKYTTSWQLSDGTEVLLRAIRPEDEPAEHEMLASLSQETLRTRFFSVVKNISHEWLILFCNIDYERQVAIVAELVQNGKKSMIGVARLIMNDDLTSGEVAVLVHDKFQGKRLGTKFVEVLVEIAKEKGLEDVRADVLTDNQSMLKVFRGLGFSVQWFPGGTSKALLRLKDQSIPERALPFEGGRR